MEQNPYAALPGRWWQRARATLLATVVALASSGCLLRSRRPITTDFLATATAPRGAPVAVDAVRVIERPDDLPEGMAWHAHGRGRPAERLAVDPGFPSAEDPHRLVGAVAAKEGDNDRGRDRLLIAARAEAGRHGANAIFVLDARHDVVTALALHVSDATSTERFPSAAELLRRSPAQLDGYSADGPPAPVDLAVPLPIASDARRGDCLAVQVALEPDARLSPGLPGVSVTRTDARGIDAISQLSRGVQRRQRELAGPVGCQLVDGRVELRLGPGILGSGKAVVQVFRRRVSEAEIAALAAKEDASFAEARARSQARAHEHCAACFPYLAGCRRPDRPGACPSYDRCLSRRYVRAEQCGR